ncbi:leucyl/phenylalanyl-tRNA--protein transferase [Nitrosomonas cryotolerans]|uniref:Leucyl/phenylalanyl-tRNA--protein transferase n=1 Tax=Nitrosomonas cryotolerans ATCC 49181 TaxID=1131553 RepID=A0A1N6H4M2_9PROT|nr:leucyl/phenylalanyl-tRNA--protein transferase [Nitrosomonas cryotolerans]SFP72031.1 leucyl/phenylalanyl-tRNA--protein transferase [Nitrosomonas cryotolerans]SIO14709.1 leucyl/phenylalanyl-tRNA--protein transferase [Nitrosomonas cryotolerans ATCC 49181]
MIPLLASHTAFPRVEMALSKPNGLLAMGGDLSPHRLLTAYRQGIFPWFNEGEPILWWSPDPRMVLFPSELKISRSLNRTLKKGHYVVRTDSHFSQVIQSCAAPRKGQPGTWIHPEMISAYMTLHEMGLAHSVETWVNEELVGGLYGVALGKVFFGESMFSCVPDASKIAFAHLVMQLERWHFGLIDCQLKTAHLASLGAREIPRAEFSQRLCELTAYPKQPEKWYFDYEPIR